MLKHLFIAQQDDWSCGFVALRMALRFFHVDLSKEEMVKRVKLRGLKIFSSGVYMPYLGILAQEAGFRSTIRYPVKSLPEIRRSIKRSKWQRLKMTQTDVKLTRGSKRWYLYRSLRTYLQLGGRVVVHIHNPPSIRHIIKAIRNGAVVIVDISCREYYGINEKWYHMLTLIPYKRKFIVLDGFKERGRLHYGKKWQRYLQKGFKYDWNRWSGEMMEIYRN